MTLTLLISVVLAGCEGGIRTERKVPDSSGDDGPMTHDRPGDVARGESGTAYSEGIFGEGGLLGTFGSGNEGSGGGGGGIGVNSYLWRATLDTISFMPVTTADAFGGVIITDWQASNDSPNERFKLNVYILGRQLRADGVRVSVFRQVLDGQQVWRDASVPAGTERKIEDAVLMRARQLRNQVLGQE